jgi:hypothetical protein
MLPFLILTPLFSPNPNICCPLPPLPPDQALAFKEDFFDVLVGLGQLDFERAKLAAKFVVKPLP